MNEVSRRVSLRYDPGTFSFRHFDTDATDQELYDMALQLNSVQEDPVKQVVKIQVSQLR